MCHLTSTYLSLGINAEEDMPQFLFNIFMQNILSSSVLGNKGCVCVLRVRVRASLLKIKEKKKEKNIHITSSAKKKLIIKLEFKDV